MKTYKEFLKEHIINESKEVHKLLAGSKEKKRLALQHPDFDSEHIDKALDMHMKPDKGKFTFYGQKGDGDEIPADAIRHKNASEANISKALTNKSSFVRLAAAKHENATTEHLKKASEDSSDHVRHAAYSNPKTPKSIRMSALKGDDFFAHAAAAKSIDLSDKENVKYIHDRLEKNLNNPKKFIQSVSFHHPHATEKHIEAGINHSDDSVRLAAIKHPNATMKHVKQATKLGGLVAHEATLITKKVEDAVREHEAHNTSVAELAKKYDVSAAKIYSAMKSNK